MTDGADATRYPFARVIGVEMSESLNRAVHQNIESNRHRLACQDIQIVQIDAAEFEVPDLVNGGLFPQPVCG
jgi:hypothetical protein